MRSLLVMTFLGLASCATPCSLDADCESGSRCNTALTAPLCQRLYSGRAGSSCSARELCESKQCSMKQCLAPGAVPSLGSTVPTSIISTRAAGSTTLTGIRFSDECGAGGRVATLVLSVDSLAPEQQVPWLPDSTVRSGAAQRPYVVFEKDELSGLNLMAKAGTFTMVQPPGGDYPLIFRLESNDGSVSATYSDAPRCP